LTLQIPDITSSLVMIEQLREKAGKQEEMETQFLLSDQAYAKAKIPPTDKVQRSLCQSLGLVRSPKNHPRNFLSRNYKQNI
jgi:hypothetical protein